MLFDTEESVLKSICVIKNLSSNSIARIKKTYVVVFIKRSTQGQ